MSTDHVRSDKSCLRPKIVCVRITAVSRKNESSTTRRTQKHFMEYHRLKFPLVNGHKCRDKLTIGLVLSIS